MVTSRAEAIAGAFLEWLAEQDEAARPEGFLDSPAAHVGVERVSGRELGDVVAVLAQRGLVRLGDEESTGSPRLSRLTAAGRAVAAGQDGSV